MVLSPDDDELPFIQRTKRQLARDMRVEGASNTTPVTRLTPGVKNLKSCTARNKMSPLQSKTCQNIMY